MSNFQPPPTWAMPVIIDEVSGKATFNPIWLRWFLDYTQNLTPGGTPDPGDVSSTIATLSFAPRAPSEFANAALLTNLQDVLQNRIFDDRQPTDYAGRALESNAQAVLQNRLFEARPAPVYLDNYENILTNQVFARRDGTFYAQSAIDNVQGALFNKMFGA